MSWTRNAVSITLKCDVCPKPSDPFKDPHPTTFVVGLTGDGTVTDARRRAKARGWRRDKLNRDICPAHPKLKGS
jgi:hypothetical protein